MTAGGPFPQALPNDPEDVAWALSTGQAMWSRGDVLEAIRWVKRASESASDAGADDRAFALARAAADLKMSSGLLSVTPAPPEVAPAIPVIPAPPPPLASPQRPAAFAPPSHPPSQRPPGNPPVRIPTATPSPGISEKRPAKIGATTLPSAGVPSPKPKPASPSSFPMPNNQPGGPGASAIPKAPLAPTTTSSTYGGPPAASQRGGTLQMSATPAPGTTTPVPGSYGAPPSNKPSSIPSAIQVPPTVVDLSAVGEETSITEMIAFPPGAGPTPKVEEPRPALIEDFPTMARAQPFELTGAVDSGRTSGTVATPPGAAITPLASRVGSSIPAPRESFPTPPTSLVPAVRVWLHNINGIARVSLLSAPRPEGAIEVVVLAVDDNINLIDYLRP